MGDDSDDDSEDEDERQPKIPPGINKSAPVPSLPSSSNKTAALAAAIGATTAVSAPPRSASHQVAVQPRLQLQPQIQQQQQQQQWPRTAGPPSPRPPQPIAAPRPGYALAAPIAALNGQASISPPLKSPGGGISPQNPFLSPSPQQPNHLRGPPPPPLARLTASPAPHPLQPPVTPITPAFIRPSPVSPSPTARSFSTSTLVSQGNGSSEPCVKFSLDQKPTPIIRGNTEETLLPSRGEKGDDFWRRFSIVAKEPTACSESSWLKKTRSGTNRLSRYIWIVGVILILAIVGGIGFGVWMSRTSPGHQQPKAIGGSDDNLAMGTTTKDTAPQTTGVGGASNSIKHVRPTNTVARREPEPTLLENMVAKHVGRNRRHQYW